MKRETRWFTAGCAATVLAIAMAAPVQAEIIWQDDFSTDQDPLSGSADVGTYDTNTTGRSVSGRGRVEASLRRAVIGDATRTVNPGEIVHYTWDMVLIDNDSFSLYEILLQLHYDGVKRVIGLRLTYTNSQPSADIADLGIEVSDGIFNDSGIDVPVDVGYKAWSIKYAQGETNALLSIEDVVTDFSIGVADSTQGIAGPRIFAGSSASRAFFDNVALTVIDPPVITTNLVEDTFALGFDSEVGFTYDLQSTELPQTNNWITTGATIEGTGDPLLMFDPTGFSTSKLYRVVKF